jgi:hypothetical protein
VSGAQGSVTGRCHPRGPRSWWAPAATHGPGTMIPRPAAWQGPFAELAAQFPYTRWGSIDDGLRATFEEDVNAGCPSSARISCRPTKYEGDGDYCTRAGRARKGWASVPTWQAVHQQARMWLTIRWPRLKERKLVAFRQAVPDVGLGIEQGTEHVPKDGAFYVLLNGQIVFSSKTKNRALAEYRRLRDELLIDGPGRQMSAEEVHAALARERGSMEVAGMLAASSRRKRDKAMAKGGRGGRGGT